jgi:hypothetical protein
MSSWRKLADELREDHESGDKRDDRDDSSVGAAPFDPLALARGWRGNLARLAVTEPLHGVDARRWRQLLDDADWLLEHFGRQAACDGWPAADLFGVLPGRDGWGGVADRLQGSRSLVMSADRASWRRMLTGTPDGFARGGSAMPRLVVLWGASL